MLCFAYYKENAIDAGRSVHGWIKLEDMLRALSDAELTVLDHFSQNNPSAEFAAERERLRQEIGDVYEDA